MLDYSLFRGFALLVLINVYLITIYWCVMKSFNSLTD